MIQMQIKINILRYQRGWNSARHVPRNGMDIRSAFLNHQQTCLQVLPSNLLGRLLFGDHLIFSWQHLNVTSPRRKKLGTLLKNAKHIPINIQSLVTSFFGGTLLGEDGNFELQFEEGTEQNMGSDKKTNLIRTVWNFLRKHEKKNYPFFWGIINPNNALIKEKSLAITIHLPCLIPPNWVI